MPNCTDQVAGLTPAETDDPQRLAGQVLAAVANHFTKHDPTGVLTEDALLVCASAAAYDLGGRSLNGQGAAMSRAALASAPERPERTTRGEYAHMLREAATACGYDWSENANRTAISTPPAPSDDAR